MGPAVLLVSLSLVVPPLSAQKLDRPRFTNHLVEAPLEVRGAEPALARPVGQPLAGPSQLIVPRETPASMQTPAQKAVRVAERHFQYGKFHLQEGKREDARREFDKALEVLLDVPEGVADREISERKFEELARLIYRYDLESLEAGVSLDSPIFTQSPLKDILNLTFPVDPSQKNKTLAHVQASASQLPLTVNDAVLSYINFFTSERGSRTLLAGLRRSGRYRDMIQRILAEEGVPQELIHLAQAESGFQPMAVSHKAAVGMWQFIAFTGAQYGLDRSKQHDHRLDPERATRAAARHLRDLYNQTGDWYLAMAAYNCGPYCVERAVQRTGYADFWELRRRRALPQETMNYVPAILAMAIVTKNLREYGLPEPGAEPPLEYDTLTATAPTSLALVADAADVPVTLIRELNPSLLRGVAPASFDIRVPKGKATQISSVLEAVPEINRASWRLHRVAPGDSLLSIARQYATPASSIVSANARLDQQFFESPETGEFLLIPAKPKPEPVQTAAARRPAANVKRTTATRSSASNARRVAAAKPAIRKTAARR